MTGIGFDKKKTGDLKSLASSSTDQFKGKLTYLTEMRDTVGLAAIQLGHRPGGPHPGAVPRRPWPRSRRRSRPASCGQVTGNYYVEDMAGGDVDHRHGLVGRRADAAGPDQKPDQDFQWALPTEGGMLWTDNMVIPKGADQQGQAELWIDFYYDPENAATVEACVNYVCPVKGAREVMLADRPGDRRTTRSSSRRRRWPRGSTSSGRRPRTRTRAGPRTSPR